MASQNEDEYFAREDALKKEKLAKEQAKELDKKEKDALRKLHHMHCPKCGFDLQTVSFKGIDIDRCFNCKGLWLDDGELEKLVEKGDGNSGEVMRTVLRIFKGK